jgi:RNA polymerase sigma-70 factor (ECF subfamily)
MQRIATNERGAFDELYDRYSPRLFRYLLRMANGQRERAEDLLHDVFVQVLERAHSFDGQRPFATWLFALGHHRVCNEIRRLQIRQQATERERHPEIECAASVEFALDWQIFKGQLDVALDELSQERCSAFLLRFVEDFSIADIARTLDCPPGTIKSRLFYTCRHLAEKLRAFDPRTDEEKIS